MRFHVFITFSVILAMFALSGDALFFSALAAYGGMQGVCAAGVMACYAAGGATWGATLGATATPTILACNAAFGACQASAAKAAALGAFIPFV